MKKTETPWGEAQSVEVIADGIEWFSTAGHGGFRLSPERNAAVNAKYPHFKTFAGGNWYEQDCDAAIVVDCFPQFFSADAVKEANEMIQKDSYFAEKKEAK